MSEKGSDHVASVLEPHTSEELEELTPTNEFHDVRLVTSLQQQRLWSRKLPPDFSFLVYACFGTFTLGFTLGLLGPLIPTLKASTHSSDVEIASLFPIRAVAFALGALAAGWCYDFYFVSATNWNSIGYLLLATTVASLLFVRDRMLLLQSDIALFGFFTGFLDTGVKSQILRIPQHVPSAMQITHFFYGVGALTVGLILSFSVRVSGSVDLGLVLMALLCVCMALASSLLPSNFLEENHRLEPQLLLRSDSTSSHQSNASSAESAETRKLSYLLVGSVAVFLFLHVSVEIAYSGWLSVYAEQRNLANKYEQFYLNSLFWGTIALFRVAGLPVTTRLKPITLLLVDLIGCVIANLLMLIWNRSPLMLWIGTLFLGTSLSTIFPCAISLPTFMKLKSSGAQTSIFVAVGSAGGQLILPLLVGALFDTRIGTISLMWAVLADTVVSLGMLVLLVWVTRRLAASPNSNANVAAF